MAKMFKAIGNKIIIKHKDDSIRKSTGGIILSGNAMSTPSDVVVGKVSSIGSDVFDIAVGDEVFVKKHHLTQLHKDEDCNVVSTCQDVNVVGVSVN